MSVSNDFFSLRNMFIIKSKAYLIPFLCSFLSSISELAKLQAKHQFLFISYVINIYPLSFILKWPHLSSIPNFEAHLQYLQMYNFAYHIQQLHDHIQNQSLIFKGNIQTWQMFLDAQLANKMIHHIQLLYSMVYQRQAIRYKKKIIWMIQQQQKKEFKQDHQQSHQQRKYQLKTFPFYDHLNPPPTQSSMVSNILSENEATRSEMVCPNKDKWLINLSDKNLTSEASELLQKGFNFAIYNQSFDPFKFYLPIESILTNEKDQVTRNHLRSQFTNTITKYFRTFPSKSYQQANRIVKDIKKDKSITLIKADKGNSLVLLSRHEYDQKMQNYLSDNTMFEKKATDPTPKVKQNIKQTLDTLKRNKLISNKIYKTCLPSTSTSTPTIFAQIKLHKPNHPLRPIINGKNNPTNNLSKFLLLVFKNFLPFCTSSLRNTQDLISKLKHVTLTPSSKLVSFDIVNMYNSIPLYLVPESIEFFLKQYNITLEFPNEVLIKLTKLVTDNSYCKFQHQYYLQKKGLAMGSPLSPVLANLTMSYIENHFIQNLQPRPTIWFRYIDDIFTIWQHTTQELTNFFNQINTLYPDIQYTMELDHDNSLHYLDLTIYNRNQQLHTKIYRKPTFTAKYLDFESNHPTVTKKGIAINLFKRALHYTSEVSCLSTEIQYIKQILSLNNYPPNIINSSLHIAKTIHQKQLTRTAQLPNTTQHNNKWISMQYVPHLSEQLTNKIKTLGYQVAHSPQNTLGSLYYQNNQHHNSLSTRGVVYLITCTCNESYIGETGRTLKERIDEHKRFSGIKYSKHQNIKYKSAVAQHVHQTGHQILWDQIKILALEQNEKLRKIKESIFIKKLSPTINFSPGVNIPDQWQWILIKSINFPLKNA